MIVVDSDIASEMMAEQPEPRVIAWLDSLEPEGLWLNAITVFEIKRGIDELDPGRRKRALLSAFEALVIGDFDNRVLPFGDPCCADRYRQEAPRATGWLRRYPKLTGSP